MDKKPGDQAASAIQADDGAELRKPHEMVVLVPRSQRVTLTGRRIYNAILQLSQVQMEGMQGMPSADHLFSAPLPTILRTSGSTGEDRTAAKRYLREMRGLEVDWESTAPGDGVKWRGFSMLSEVAIEVRNGENWVYWSFPPTIMGALREPARWARIDLDVLASLGSYVAVALYEICARYRDNPSGLTSKKPVTWWTDALSPGPAGSERREWRKFKSERVKSAVEEINAETDLEIELIEHKQGRVVFEAQFAVRKKRTVKPRKIASNVDAHLILRGESLGIREMKLEGLIKEFGEDQVRQKVELLEQRAANSRLRGVENGFSYLRSLLRNDAGSDVQPSDEAVTRLLNSSEQEAAAKQGPKLAVQVPDRGWLNERIASIKSEIQALSPDQRQSLADSAVQELTEKGLLNAVITRRVAQGDVLHGMLGSVVVKLYATRIYGPDWDKQADMFA